MPTRKSQHAPDEYWRTQIREHRGLSFGFGHSTIPGCFIIEACHEDFPMPIATVWYSFNRNHRCIEILNSFVSERYRRCGLRTSLNQKLFDAYPTVTVIASGGGTKEGKAWMKATGYKRVHDHWEYRRNG